MIEDPNNENENTVVSPPPTIVPPPLEHANYPRTGGVPQSPSNANEDPLRFVLPVNPSGWCLISGYLGLGSVLLIFAPFALLSGLLGLREIKANPTKTGKGRAIFGVAMGGVFTLLLIFVIIKSLTG